MATDGDDGAAAAGGESAVMPAKFSYAPEDAFPRPLRFLGCLVHQICDALKEGSKLNMG